MPKDILVIGAGQAGLAVAYYLRRAGADFLLLDAEAGAGGAWRHAWDSLHCFSPAAYSSLPGWQMPRDTTDEYPGRDDVINYLRQYEERYAFEIERPVTVQAVERDGETFVAKTDRGARHARIIISATGTWNCPYIPEYAGRAAFRGEQMHSAHYHSPQSFAGKTVLIVGGGNSAAQILAEVSEITETIWVTTKEPAFLPDDVDGRVLFARATARIRNGQSGILPGGFGDIVMVPPVREARARGVLHSVRPFEKFTQQGVVWHDGSETTVDAVIWCTGFNAALEHLRPLGVIEQDGKVAVEHNQAVRAPGLWLMGYGDWTGAASATLIGSGRTAREIVPRIMAALPKSTTRSGPL